MSVKNNNKIKWLGYFKDRKVIRLFLMDTFFALLIASFTVAIPFLTKFITSKAIGKDIEGVVVGFSIFAGMLLIRIMSDFIVTYWGHQMGGLIERKMRADALKHMHKFSMKEFETNNAGVFVSRIVTDLKDISEIAHHSFEDLIVALATFTGAFTFLFLESWIAGVALLGTVLIGSVITYFVTKKWKILWKSVREFSSKLSGAVSQQSGNISEIKTMNLQNKLLDNFEMGQEKYFGEFKKFYKREGAFVMTNAFFVTLNTLVALLIGALLYINGELDYAGMAGIASAAATLNYPMQKFAAVYSLLSNGFASIERFYDFIGHTHEVDNGKRQLENVKGNIEFKNVSFTYKEENGPVLKNFNLNIKKGESIAFVGKTGIGKSTVIKLLLRLYNFQEGQVIIDDSEIQDVTLESLRNNITYIQQQPIIFDDSIINNVKIGNFDATEEEVIDAMKLAHVDKIAEKLDLGYESLVGTNGSQLSGGEKQRIAIARSFIKKTNILLLDEATSALDNITEKIINNAMRVMAKNRTTIIVAHRLSTIQWVDRIIVLDKYGVILEEGKYDDLYKKKGHLYNLAIGGEDLQ